MAGIAPEVANAYQILVQAYLDDTAANKKTQIVWVKQGAAWYLASTLRR